MGPFFASLKMVEAFSEVMFSQSLEKGHASQTQKWYQRLKKFHCMETPDLEKSANQLWSDPFTHRCYTMKIEHMGKFLL